jgi:hypothetical protein
MIPTPGEGYVLTRKIRVCPKCGSRIDQVKSSVGGWLVPLTYYCEDEECGYSGSIYVEIDIGDADDLRRVMNGDSNSK